MIAYTVLNHHRWKTAASFSRKNVSTALERVTAPEEIDLSAQTLIHDALCKHGMQQINVCLKGISSHFTVLAALK